MSGMVAGGKGLRKITCASLKKKPVIKLAMLEKCSFLKIWEERPLVKGLAKAEFQWRGTRGERNMVGWATCSCALLPDQRAIHPESGSALPRTIRQRWRVGKHQQLEELRAGESVRHRWGTTWRSHWYRSSRPGEQKDQTVPQWHCPERSAGQRRLRQRPCVPRTRHSEAHPEPVRDRRRNC